MLNLCTFLVSSNGRIFFLFKFSSFVGRVFPKKHFLKKNQILIFYCTMRNSLKVNFLFLIKTINMLNLTVRRAIWPAHSHFNVVTLLMTAVSFFEILPKKVAFPISYSSAIMYIMGHDTQNAPLHTFHHLNSNRL